MEHTMRLQKVAFSLIKKGTKNIELRLNDEKRQQIQIGDKIIFRLCNSDKEEIKATVCALHRSDSFVNLLKQLSLYDCGFSGIKDEHKAAECMREYYSKELEKQYGVVGIELSEVYYKTKWLSDDSPALRFITGEKWRRMYNFNWETRNFFTITTEKLIINITGGSVIFKYKEPEQLIKIIKGFNYLYTGDVKPDETELMALENGKHFYVFSLSDFGQTKKVTLPRNYESIDVCGKYSEDGKILYIPVYRFIENEGYIHKICQYETDTYSLISMDSISKEEYYSGWHWR